MQGRADKPLLSSSRWTKPGGSQGNPLVAGVQGSTREKSSILAACLIKWCIVILPRRDNKRGSALPPPHNGSGGGGHRRAYSGRGQRPAPVVTVARVYLQPPPLSAHCAN